MVPSRLHESHQSKFQFVSSIELIEHSDLSAHVYRVTEVAQTEPGGDRCVESRGGGGGRQSDVTHPLVVRVGVQREHGRLVGVADLVQQLPHEPLVQLVSQQQRVLTETQHPSQHTSKSHTGIK